MECTEIYLEYAGDMLGFTRGECRVCLDHVCLLLVLCVEVLLTSDRMSCSCLCPGPSLYSLNPACTRSFYPCRRGDSEHLWSPGEGAAGFL